ncbi:class I SAM-dependent methyltransferase [Sphingomonas baiyangensis]|uniref:class I SAM-dependent methyltransferase n=1 Tax=Sphingomonas baiyangensis TaxID=2572576 RepID=UPI0020163F24|nr:class I SAM-dependent methyltransferase [Sphingomonas baiyangensis]
MKRRAILHALGPGPIGRVLELAAGNGSNSAAIAPRARRLDATEATASGIALVASAIAQEAPRARAMQLAVPGHFPQPQYDAIVIAELLYYLTPRQMQRTARDTAAALRGGGTLILAHHRIDFPDFAQRAEGIQTRFLAATGRAWSKRAVRCTSRWIVLSCRLTDARRETATPRNHEHRSSSALLTV